MTRPSFMSNLTAEEEAKVTELQEAVARDIEGSPSLQAFCTRSCYVRYLRARSWNVHKAAKMLEETLKWRASYKPEQIRWEDIAHEARDGKMFVLEHPDREGRPVVMMRPRNESSTNNDTRLKYLVYTLEQASRRADDWADDCKMTWLVDFVGYSRKNAPPIKIALQTLHILQNHYPERLGKAVSFQPPTIFDLLWRAVSPFIDPVTRKKLVFLNKKEVAAGHMWEHFSQEHLDEGLGGTLPAEQWFDLVRLEERYRLADAAADRELALAASSRGASAAAELDAGTAAVAAGAPAAPSPQASSPGASVSSEGGSSTIGEEASGSVADGSVVASVGNSSRECEQEQQGGGEGLQKVEEGVGALKVAS